MLASLSRLLAVPLSLPTAVAHRADAVVVFGAPCGPGKTLAPAVRERLNIAVSLFHRGQAPLVCLTGHRGEAEAMAEHATELGVPEASLCIEPRARNTRENAILSARLLRSAGCRSAWAATQPFHLRRACFWLRRAGLTPYAWHDSASIQYDESIRALRWVAREYAAWAGVGVARLAARD